MGMEMKAGLTKIRQFHSAIPAIAARPQCPRSLDVTHEDTLSSATSRIIRLSGRPGATLRNNRPRVLRQNRRRLVELGRLNRVDL
jgi:hypothetical protein